MSLLGSLFARSPVRPLQEHMQVAVACAREVLPLFEDMAAGRTDTLPAHRARIDELEHQADQIKNEIRLHLPKRLFMAFERRDMLEILDCQDSIADVAQDIAGLVDQRSMGLPEGLAEPVLALVRRVIVACEYAEKVIAELDELVETGFALASRRWSRSSTAWRVRPTCSAKTRAECCSASRASSGWVRTSGTDSSAGSRIWRITRSALATGRGC
jgi:predicted phosphate transport protein (TIGR00153 family)